MTPDNFDDLQKLLAWKRHEQPPPGYFNQFSQKVIARIEVEEWRYQSSWWQRLVASFDAKPVFACAYGLSMGGLLFLGLGLAQILEQEQASTPPVTSPWAAVRTSVRLPESGGWLNQSMTSQSYPLANSSITPVLSTTPVIGTAAPRFLFDGSFGGSQVRPASLNVGGN